MAGTDPTLWTAEPEAAAQRCPGLVIRYKFAQNPAREITFEVGQRDIRIRRPTGFPGNTKRKRGIRTQITEFSNSSRRRLLFNARNLLGLGIMLTLTYPSEYPADGRTVKDHWRCFRQWMVRNGVEYGLWVLEFQQRGAPHFHVFFKTRVDSNAVADVWYKIVGSEDPKHLLAGTRIEKFRHPPALGSYVMKYAAKLQQKEVPVEFSNVGRFWGTWGNVAAYRVIKLPQVAAKRFIRIVRRAHLTIRKDWKYRRHFRDNGVAGFMAWDSAPAVRRIIDEFFETGLLCPT